MNTTTLILSLAIAALAFAAAYVGSRYGLVGVATGVSIACFAEFVAINAYAFSHFCSARDIVVLIARLTATVVAVVLVTLTVERFVPAGPPLIAWFGGWRLLVIGLLALPLLARAARRIWRLQAPDSVDNVSSGH